LKREFKPQPWLGHIPRDRGSIWYIAPVLADIAGVLLVLGIVAWILLAVFS
jgi:hypothetical protein